MQKNKFFSHNFDLEIKLIQKSCNLIGWENFGPYLRNQICNNVNFRYRPNSEKLMTKFSNKFKKPYFWPRFGPFNPFFGQYFCFQKIRLCQAQPHMSP